jgi:hypothetical protein
LPTADAENEKQDAEKGIVPFFNSSTRLVAAHVRDEAI